MCEFGSTLPRPVIVFYIYANVPLSPTFSYSLDKITASDMACNREIGDDIDGVPDLHAENGNDGAVGGTSIQHPSEGGNGDITPGLADELLGE